MKDNKHTQFAITEYLLKHRGEFVKIEDMQVDLLIPKTKHLNSYDKSIQILIDKGHILRIGNDVKIVE